MRWERIQGDRGWRLSTVLLDTHDLGETEECLRALFASVRITAGWRGLPTHSRLERTQVGSLSVGDMAFGFDMSYDTEPPDAVLLCRMRAGTLEEQRRGQPGESFGPGSVAAIGAIAGVPFTGLVCQARCHVLAINRGWFSDVATDPPGNAPDSVHLTGTAAVSAAANDRLVNTVDHVCQQVITNAHAMESPLLLGALRRYLTVGILTTFPNTALFDPTIEDRHDTTPVLLRRAIAYIDDHAHIDISLADIGSQVDVTPRALQYMFRKHRDCTPMEYVRRVRLHHAHHDLVAGNPSTTTVGRIAARWGFAHVGRFAVYYRKQYGRSPHQTLRQ